MPRIPCTMVSFAFPTLTLPASALALALLLAGCGSTEYTRPEVFVPKEWPGEQQYGMKGPVAGKVEWRNYFADLRLQRLIERALEYNHDMRLAAIRVEEARAAYGVTNADRTPTLSLNATGSVASVPTSVSSATTGYTSSRYDLTNSMLSYEIDLWGRLANLSDAAKANLLATEASRRAMRATLIGAVANVYYTQLEQVETLSLAKATVLNREMALEIIIQAFEGGAVSRLEVLQAESVLEAAKSAVSLSAGQLANAENLMRSLIGELPADLPQGKGLTASLDTEFMTGLPSEVLLERPDILAVEQRLIAANANINAARAAFLPKILLTAGFGMASRSLVNLFTAGQAWSFAPSVSIPVFDGGRTAGNLDLAVIRQNIAVVEYERAIQQAFREVADLLASRASFVEQVRSAEASLKVQDGRLLVVQARHKAGAANYLEVLDVLRDQFAAQRTLIQARRGQLSTAAQLFKALGGGGE